jgi:hypothetical protein
MSNNTNSKFSKDTIRAGVHGVKTSYVYGHQNSDVIYVQNSMDVENLSGDTMMSLHTNNDDNTLLQFVSSNVFKASVGYNNTSNQLEICGVGSTKKIGIDSSALYPLTNTAYSFGKTGNRWSTVFTEALNATGTITLGDSATIVPATNTTVNLGSAEYAFNNIYGSVIGSASLNLLKSGGTMSGNLNMGNQSITNVNNLSTSGTVSFTGITGAGFLAIDANGAITSSSSTVTDGSITNAKLATAVASANTASAIVARDSSGNFSAGTITASLTGAASLNVLKTGDTISGTLITNGLTISGLNSIGIVHTDTNGVCSTGLIDNSDISGSAAIADTKLATISTTGKVSNSATTATSANTASAIVARDSSGNLSAGTITSTGLALGSLGTCISSTSTDLLIGHTTTNGNVKITLNPSNGYGSFIVRNSNNAELLAVYSDENIICRHLLPYANNTFWVGSESTRWAHGWFNSCNVNTLTASTLTANALTVAPSDNSALGTVLNPSAYNSVIQMEDGLGAGSTLRAGTTQGSASVQSGYVRLTPDSPSQQGQLVYRGHPGNSFTMEFELRIGNIAGADATWFFFNNNTAPTNLTANTANCGGYSIVIDEYQDDELNLYWNGSDTPNGLLATTNLSTSSSNVGLSSGSWMRIKIVFCINQFWITINEWAVPGFYPFTDTRRSLSQANDYYGFGSFTGGVSTTHDIKNVRLSKSNGGPITPMNDVCVLGTNGKMAVQDSSAVERFSVTNSGTTSVTGSLSVSGGQGSLNVYSPGTDSGVKTNIVLTTSGKSFMELGLNNSGDQYTPYLYCDNKNDGRNGGSFAGFVFTTSTTGGLNTRSILPLDSNTHNLGSSDKRWNDIFSKYIYLNDFIRPQNNNSGEIGGSSSYWESMYLNKLTLRNWILPISDGGAKLGQANLKFSEVWGNNWNSSSDERLKENIVDSSLGLTFINALRPVSYKFKDYYTPGGVDDNGNVETIHNTFHRTHYGFLAQQVETTITNAGLTTEDFAGFVHDPETDVYALRYTEFISPMVKAIQELSATLATVQARLATAEEKLARNNIS